MGDENGLPHMKRSGGSHRRLSSTLGVRLAGAALCTAGLAFIGFGTIGSPLSLFGAKNTTVTVTDPGCNSTTTNCINESFEGKTVAQDNVSCDFPSAIPTDDAFLFVLPASGNPKATFVPGTFFAIFAGIPNPVPGLVGAGGNNTNKFAEVYVPAGSILEEAYSQVTDGTTAIFGESFNVTGGCVANSTTTTSNTTATLSTTKTVTAPGTTVTTTVSAPATTKTAPGTTRTSTVSTTTTLTSPTTVTNHTTATNTATTVVSNTTTTTVTAPGTTVTATTTVPTTQTVTTVTTSNHTATTTITVPATVTAPTTVTNTATATTTKTVTGGTGASSTSPSSSSSSSRTPTAGVQAATTTPSTGGGSDIEFGAGLVLLVAGGGLIAGANRITRRKKN
jgi:hypothetical protein